MKTVPQVLKDPALDELLLRDGFVTFPAFDADRLSALRDEFGKRRGWTGTGFHSDLVLDDPDYRAAASAAIGASLDDDAAALFVAHQPFLRNFLCKFPGPDSALYLHRDWMYVDERNGARTYVVWAPLEDVTGHNGQLRVLRGSHRLDSGLRGSALIAPWLRHTEVIEDRLLSIPVPLGHVVVFDNALVHCSYPNHTDSPRVVAAVGMRPMDAPLVHFRRIDATTAARYEVDEQFFLKATPQGLDAGPVGLPSAETILLDQLDLDGSELGARLDAGWRGRTERARHRWQKVRVAATTRSGAALGGLRRAADRGPSVGRDVVGRARSTAERAGAWASNFPSTAAVAVLSLNECYINKLGPATPAIWDPGKFEWARRIEAGWPDIRAEVEALLAGPTDIPHIEEVTGGIPQGNVGPWRSFVMMHQGRWIDWNCDRCPRTTALVRDIPGLTVAGFSVLEPGTHITEHRGPNKGALRYQLGVQVPGDDGDCRIRVGDEMLVWRDGEGVMFDFTVPHEAWNDSAGIRVLLMLEVLTPLPWYIDGPNRLAQRAMSWFPTTRDLTNRLRALEPSLRRAV